MATFTEELKTLHDDLVRYADDMYTAGRRNIGDRLLRIAEAVRQLSVLLDDARENKGE